MTRQHQRWAQMAMIGVPSLVGMFLYLTCNVSSPELKVLLLLSSLCGLILTLLYMLGVNVWAGGRLDPNDESQHKG